MMQWAIVSQFDVDYYAGEAGAAAAEYAKAGDAMMQEVVSKSPRIHVDIDMRAPVIQVPLDTND